MPKYYQKNVERLPLYFVGEDSATSRKRSDGTQLTIARALAGYHIGLFVSLNFGSVEFFVNCGYLVTLPETFPETMKLLNCHKWHWIHGKEVFWDHGEWRDASI